jgi:hypothetical protein
MKGLFTTVCIGLLLLSGCATVHESGITKDDKTLSLNADEGMVLLSIQVSNHYKPDYQPQIIVVNVETPNATSKKDRHNFKTDLDGTISSADGTRYLMRMRLKEGKYIARGAFCVYNSIFVHASCFLPIHAEFEVKGNTITYLGRVSAVMRERTGDEFRAGPVIPLIDQSVSGFSSSTFDVTIDNHYDEDIKAFKSNFQALRNETIISDILPPFDREKAQLWWKKH